jgi:hypothetical protein
MYQIALASIKATFLLQYRRVFPLPNIQRFCDICLGIVVLLGISQALIGGLFCVPLSVWWDVNGDKEGHCIDVVAWWYSNAVINIVTDVVIFTIPLTLLHTLPLQLGQMIVLMVVFSLGFL